MTGSIFTDGNEYHRVYIAAESYVGLVNFGFEAIFVLCAAVWICRQPLRSPALGSRNLHRISATVALIFDFISECLYLFYDGGMILIAISSIVESLAYAFLGLAFVLEYRKLRTEASLDPLCFKHRLRFSHLSFLAASWIFSVIPDYLRIALYWNLGAPGRTEARSLWISKPQFVVLLACPYLQSLTFSASLGARLLFYPSNKIHIGQFPSSASLLPVSVLQSKFFKFSTTFWIASSLIGVLPGLYLFSDFFATLSFLWFTCGLAVLYYPDISNELIQEVRWLVRLASSPTGKRVVGVITFALGTISAWLGATGKPNLAIAGAILATVSGALPFLSSSDRESAMSTPELLPLPAVVNSHRSTRLGPLPSASPRT